MGEDVLHLHQPIHVERGLRVAHAQKRSRNSRRVKRTSQRGNPCACILSATSAHSPPSTLRVCGGSSSRRAAQNLMRETIGERDAGRDHFHIFDCPGALM